LTGRRPAPDHRHKPRYNKDMRPLSRGNIAPAKMIKMIRRLRHGRRLILREAGAYLMAFSRSCALFLVEPLFAFSAAA